MLTQFFPPPVNRSRAAAAIEAREIRTEEETERERADSGKLEWGAGSGGGGGARERERPILIQADQVDRTDFSGARRPAGNKRRIVGRFVCCLSRKSDIFE